MTDFAVWEPTERSLKLAERLRDQYAVSTLRSHRDWRREGRYRTLRNKERYIPDNYRGDVDAQTICPAIGVDGRKIETGAIHNSGKSVIEIVNAIGVVDWHDDAGFPQYSNFVVLRNRQYEVKQRGAKRVPDQPFGSIIRLNVLKTHALHPSKDREKIDALDHGLWLAAGFSTRNAIERDEILTVYERSLSVSGF